MNQDAMHECGTIVRKQYPAEARTVGTEERAVQLTISTDAPDRDHDTLNASGWHLDNYRSNPVVLWAHDYRELPIAKALRVWVGDGQLHAIAHFVEPEISALGETVFQMLRRGYLNAASVGFAPIKWVRNEDTGGVDYIEQELLEFSIVPVPANPGALVARSKVARIDLAPLAAWARGFVDECHAGGSGVSASQQSIPDRKLFDQLFDVPGLRPLVEMREAVEFSVHTLLGGREGLAREIDAALRRARGRLD